MFDVSTSFKDLMDFKPPEVRPHQPAEMPPWQDGGYHWRFYQDHSHSVFYGEYWYFNFTDHKSGLSGMIAFGAFNPGDWLGQGRFAISSAIFNADGDQNYIQMDSYPIAQMTASETTADVRLNGQQVVFAETRDRYRVKASSKDGRLSVDLTYHSLDQPTLASEDIKGELDWEFNWWVLQLPGARVEGTVTFDGKVFTLEQGAGYHDHSWGIWLLPARIWAWATCAVPDKDISLMLGYMTGFDVNFCHMAVGDVRASFDSRTAQEMKWDFGTKDSWETLSPWLLWPSPTKATVKTVDSTGLFRLEGEWSVTYNNLFVLPSPMALFEQEAMLSATLYKRDSVGDSWTQVGLVSDVSGHSEFVSRWYSPVRPARKPK